MKTKFFQILGVVAVSVLSFNSCTTDACKDVVCQNAGVCEDGTCVCAVGYEGTNCQTLVRAKYLGSYNVNETCSASTDTYAITIAAGATDGSVTISNIYDAGLVITGTVNADGGVTIASQSFGTATISGSMTKTGGVITINFTIALAGNSDSCSAVTQ
jgi:hypothetical protein